MLNQTTNIARVLGIKEEDCKFYFCSTQIDDFIVGTR